jgi:sortase A
MPEDRKLETKKRTAHAKNWGILTLAVIMLCSGLYMLLLLMAPQITPVIVHRWNHPVAHTKTELKEDRVYIPKLKLNLTFKSGDESVLLHNLWHRVPENGDPEKVGNFVLAGHRFAMGPTPGETTQRSPLYHIDIMQPGDKMYVDFKGKRYEYTIAERLTVKPTQVEIEAPSKEEKLTLYTCTLGGEADGREVIIAHLTQKDVDPSLQF